MNIAFKRLNHIQICIPIGKENEARDFYCDILGLEEIKKPEFLKKNGGFWLRISDIELHIGAEPQIHPSKRHPAFEVEHLSKIKQYLTTSGIKIKEDKSLPLYRRFSLYDPFGNRIEFLEEKSSEEMNYLGKEVKIIIDRPLESQHPTYHFEYPINYGYVPHSLGGDSHPIDAYILGISKPLEKFRGIVKAIVLRHDDAENKLIVCPDEYHPNKKEIENAIHFQEQYFDSEIILIEDI